MATKVCTVFVNTTKIWVINGTTVKNTRQHASLQNYLQIYSTDYISAGRQNTDFGWIRGIIVQPLAQICFSTSEIWNRTRPIALVQNQHKGVISAQKDNYTLVEFMYLVFTRMPGQGYRRRLRSLLLCLCYVFRVLINPLVCWFSTSQ